MSLTLRVIIGTYLILLFKFNNILDKKKSKSKKSRNALKNLNLNLNVSINSLKKRKTKKILKLKSVGKKIKNLSAKKKEKNENFYTLNEAGHFEDITYKEIDGKIGLREPIYCFCNYVSNGNMVKCHNPKVIIFNLKSYYICSALESGFIITA